MTVYEPRWCQECKRITDHYQIEHGHLAELICDSCETPATVPNRRELVEVS